MKIAIGNDHAGLLLKPVVVDYLIAKGHVVVDLGTNEAASCSYTTFARQVGETVAKQEADCGILICGTGVGISIAANKVPGVRAACVSEPFSAKMSKQHNNSNVLCFGSRVVGAGLALLMVEQWLEAEFEGGRHADRVNDIECFCCE